MASPRLSFKIAFSAGCVLSLVGIMVILGWHTHHSGLIQILPSSVPMQYNTALSFLFCGLALIAVVNKREGLALLLAVLPAILGSFTLAEYLFKVDLKIDQIFMKAYIVTKTSHAGRMSPITAFCFTLVASGLILTSRFSPTSRVGIHLVLGTLLLAFGATAICGYLLGIEAAYSWGILTQMAIHTAICFCLLGIGFLAVSWQRIQSFLLVVFTLFIGTLVSLMALQILSNAENQNIRNQIRHLEKNQVAAVEKEFFILHNYLEAFRAFYEGSRSVEKEEFQIFWQRVSRGAAVSAFEWLPRVAGEERALFEETEQKKGYPGFFIQDLTLKNKLVRAPERNIYFPVLYAEPGETNKRVFGFDHYADPVRREAIEEAQGLQRMVATELVTLFRAQQEDRLGVIVFNPIYREGVLSGFITAVVQTQLFFEKALIDTGNVPMEVSIHDITEAGIQRPLFELNSEGREKSDRLKWKSYEYEKKIIFAERAYLITCRFSPQTIMSLLTWYPQIAFLTLLFLSSMGSFFFWQSLQHSKIL